MTYVCGWDGGGSKTEVLCCGANGCEMGRASFGPLNINGASRERVAQTVSDAIGYMAAMPGGLEGCRKLVIGTAGVSNEKIFDFLTGCVREAGYTGVLSIVGDQEIALAGAIDGAGAVLIAGTGSICCGTDMRGNWTRVGGRGHLIDDGGSGYAVGRDILSAVVRAQDGRGEKTCLTKAVHAQLNTADAADIVTWIYSPGVGKKEIAALAPLLLQALEAGDNAAKAIAENAAQELAALAIAAWKNLCLDEGELALTGSVLTHYGAIRERLTALCHAQFPRMRIISPRGTAAQGAAKLAAKD